MVRMRSTTSIDEKIENAQQNFEKARIKYDAAAKELDDLMAKKKAMQNEELLKLFTKSSKSFEEIKTFLTGEAED
jgi:hypothetical protein